jgi:hypothetical protein
VRLWVPVVPVHPLPVCIYLFAPSPLNNARVPYAYARANTLGPLGPTLKAEGLNRDRNRDRHPDHYWDTRRYLHSRAFPLRALYRSHPKERSERATLFLSDWDH